MTSRCRFFWIFLPLLLPASQAADLPPAAERFDFQRDIRPILENSCVSCHGPRQQKGGFRLDSSEHLRKGGENGAPFANGKSAEAALIHRVARRDADEAMPPKESQALKPEQVGKLRAWIDAGAPWPEGFVIRDTAPLELTQADLAQLPPVANRKIDFVKDVQPIFAGACYDCHGPRHQEANFRLDHKPTLFAGGELGAALVKGDGGASTLLHFVAGLRPEGRMPKKGDPLTPEQIGILRAWIDQGADFPDEASVTIEDKRDHWSFQAPVQAPLPQNGESHPIDAFVKERLTREGLDFSPEAAPSTLLRRIHLDLTGLPPTIEEQRAFEAESIRNPQSAIPPTGSSPPPTTANAGAVTGSTRRAMRTVMVTRRTNRASTTSTATGSSGRSTATCPTTSSSSSRSRAISCRRRRRSRSSRRATCAIRCSTRKVASIPSSSAWRRCSTAWTRSEKGFSRSG